MPITYLEGDATCPQIDGPKIIAHVVNSSGGWGRGFVLAVSDRWLGPEQRYRKWYASKKNFKLGAVQTLQVEPDIWVCNMLAQEGYLTTKKHGPPLRLPRLKECLDLLKEAAIERHASVHMPRIGCGLGGSDWDVVGLMVEQSLGEVPVYVYDLYPQSVVRQT